MTSPRTGDTDAAQAPLGASPRSRFAEISADALRYWERRRLVYNLALAAVVLAEVLATWPKSMRYLTWNMGLGLFMLAVLANIAYCAVYAVDLFVQYSGIRTILLRWRWVLLATGIGFAAVITHFITRTVLSAGEMP